MQTRVLLFFTLTAALTLVASSVPAPIGRADEAEDPGEHLDFEGWERRVDAGSILYDAVFSALPSIRLRAHRSAGLGATLDAIDEVDGERWVQTIGNDGSANGRTALQVNDSGSRIVTTRNSDTATPMTWIVDAPVHLAGALWVPGVQAGADHAFPQRRRAPDIDMSQVDLAGPDGSGAIVPFVAIRDTSPHTAPGGGVLIPHDRPSIAFLSCTAMTPPSGHMQIALETGGTRVVAQEFFADKSRRSGLTVLVVFWPASLGPLPPTTAPAGAEIAAIIELARGSGIRTGVAPAPARGASAAFTWYLKPFPDGTRAETVSDDGTVIARDMTVSADSTWLADAGPAQAQWERVEPSEPPTDRVLRKALHADDPAWWPATRDWARVKPGSAMPLRNALTHVERFGDSGTLIWRMAERADTRTTLPKLTMTRDRVTLVWIADPEVAR